MLSYRSKINIVFVQGAPRFIYLHWLCPILSTFVMTTLSPLFNISPHLSFTVWVSISCISWSWVIAICLLDSNSSILLLLSCILAIEIFFLRSISSKFLFLSGIFISYFISNERVYTFSFISLSRMLFPMKDYTLSLLYLYLVCYFQWRSIYFLSCTSISYHSLCVHGTVPSLFESYVWIINLLSHLTFSIYLFIHG